MTAMNPGLELDLSVRLAASIDGHTAALNREAQWRERVARAVTQVPFAGSIDISGGAGSSTRGRDKLQAKTGYIWSIRRITAYGWSAGTVTAYRNDLNGEPMMPFPVPAVNTIGRGEELLMPGDALVWNATGITLTGTILQYWGVADCFESWYLPHYLSQAMGNYPFGANPALILQAATPLAGFPLVNGTPNIVTWTAPNDGKLHRVLPALTMDVISAMTGGIITALFTLPDGTTAGSDLIQPQAATGFNYSFSLAYFPMPIAPGSMFTIGQSSALTSGQATVWAEIWGS